MRSQKNAALASAAGSDGQLRQQVFQVDQVVVENLLGDIQQLEDFRVADRIENTLPFFPAHNNVPVPQDGQLLGQSALFRVHARTKVIHADFAAAQLVQNSNSQGVRQRFEELRFELTKFRH